jgi:hypothetical protein
MLNTLDTEKEDTDNAQLFKTLLLLLKNIEFDLYEGNNESSTNNNKPDTYNDTLDKYSNLHSWFNRNVKSKITDWESLRIKFVDYKIPSINNIKSNNENSATAELFLTSKNKREFATAKINKQSMPPKSRKKSSGKKSSGKNSSRKNSSIKLSKKTKKISGYSGNFNESNFVL